MSKLLSVSIPDELMASTEALARRTGQSRSEVVRTALRRHLSDREWEELFRYGESLAESAGIGPEDVEDLVDRTRAETRAGIATPPEVEALIERLARGERPT